MEHVTTYYLFGFIPVWSKVEVIDPTYVPDQWTNEGYDYE